MHLKLTRYYMLHCLSTLFVVCAVCGTAMQEPSLSDNPDNEKPFFSKIISRGLHMLFDPPPEQECRMTVPELIQHLGYQAEIHEVTTKDGYILELHRIPTGKDGRSLNSREPILLKHGLTSSSFCFVGNLANQSLGFVLADNGYDVWLGNTRGNFYAKKHVSLSQDDNDFWDFGIDEIAEFDLPAMIEYILTTTNKSQLAYIGHSQGSSEALALFSSTKDFNDKIRMWIALSPPTTLASMNTALFSFLSTNSKVLKYILDTIDVHEILGYKNLLQFFGEKICVDAVFADGCLTILEKFIDIRHLNKTRMSIYLTHAGHQTSIRTLLHFAQIHNSKTFSRYDLGYRENWRKYGQMNPPVYDITQLNIPTAVIYGSDDVVTTPQDIKETAKMLPNLIELIEMKDWAHVDLVLAAEDSGQINKEVLRLLKQKQN